MSEPYDLAGKVVLVTGSSRGVGAAIAVAAAAKGAKVACAARSTKASPKPLPGTIDETVEAVIDAGGEALAVPTDLTSADDIEAMVTAPVEAWGRLDVLVNNAAVTFVGEVDIPLKRYDLIMEINLRAPLLTVRVALPHLRAAGRGRILSLSSQAALRPVPGLMSYGMSKLALERMTTDLARQLYPDRIAVNCFRIDIPVASEGTLANMGDIDLTDWEPTSVPADGIIWMLEQPDDYSGRCESMWDLRHREQIMPTRAQEEYTTKPPLQFINGLYDLETQDAFARGAKKGRRLNVDLSGKTALVTGAASGVGAACARRDAEAGARVICTDVADDSGQQVADEIGGQYRHLDVADSSAWATLTEELADDPGHLQVAHLNAGIMMGLGNIAEMSDEDYLRIIGINQHGVVFGLRAAVPLLEAAGGGHVLVTGSMASFSPLPVDLGYSMSKHAIAALVRSAAPNLAEQGISLNAICPATVGTGFLGGNRDRLEAAGMVIMDSEEVAEASMAILDSGLTGECFALFKGRAPEPFPFASIPGSDYRSRR